MSLDLVLGVTHQLFIILIIATKQAHHTTEDYYSHLGGGEAAGTF